MQIYICLCYLCLFFTSVLTYCMITDRLISSSFFLIFYLFQTVVIESFGGDFDPQDLMSRLVTSQSIYEELSCQQAAVSSDENFIKRRKKELCPPFYFNLHRHSPKGSLLISSFLVLFLVCSCSSPLISNRVLFISDYIFTYHFLFYM